MDVHALTATPTADVSVGGPSPVVRKTLVLASEMYNSATGEWDAVRVLADTASEATLGSSAYVHSTGATDAWSLRGINAATRATSSGRVTMRVQPDGDIVTLPVLSFGDLAGGNVKLLINATTSKAFGLVPSDLNSAATPVADLPPLVFSADPPLVTATPTVPTNGRSAQPLVAPGLACARPAMTSALFLDGLMPDSPADGPDPYVTGEGLLRPLSTGRASSADSAGTANVLLTDANIGRILEDCDGDPFPQTTWTLDDIAFGADATPAQIEASGLPNVSPGGVLSLDQVRELKQIFSDRAAAFATTKIPPLNKAPPVKVVLKPDDPNARYPSRPHHCGPPKLGPNARKYLFKLKEHYLRNDVIFANPHSQWATRRHLVGKGAADDAGLYKGLRPTDDGRPVNARTVPKRYPVPNGPDEVRRASRRCFCSFSSDVNAAFTSFPVDEGSYDYFTTWLPEGPEPNDGFKKYSSKRMVFGFSNAPAEMLLYYDQMKASLPSGTRKRLAMFFDDCKLNSPPAGDDAEAAWQQFKQDLIALLDACIKFGIQLGPLKTRVGFKKALFYGFLTSTDGGSSLSAANIEAIRVLQYPSNDKELRSVLGFLTQQRNWVANYSASTASMTKLLKKGVPFNFGPEQQRDFETLRRQLMESTSNYAPDYSQPFLVTTDASDYAIGSRTYQVIDGVERTIGYYSRTLSSAEADLPVYFRECLGVLMGIAKARVYALSSPFTLVVKTDQKSLIFCSKIRKGSLSTFRLASVADVNFRLEWIPGADNVVADFLSRYPSSSSHSLTGEGVLRALGTLLETLDQRMRDAQRVWVYACGNTTDAARRVQHWRRPRNKIAVSAPTANKMASSWDLAILAPKVVSSPAVCAQLLLTGQPFACLLPLDLLSVVALKHKGQFDKRTFDLLRDASKIAMPTANFVWVVGGTKFPDVISMVVAAQQAPERASVARVRLELSGPLPVDATILECAAQPVHRVWDVDVSATSAAGVEFAASHSARRLRVLLKDRGAQTTGKKAELVERLAELLGEHFINDADRAEVDAGRRRAEEATRGDLLFYDAPDYSNSEVGTPTKQLLRAALLANVGDKSDWAAEQRDEDCPARFRVTRADGLMLYDPGNGSTRVVVPQQRRRRILQLVHEELGHNVSSMTREVSRAFYWPSLAHDAKAFCKACEQCLVNKTRIDHQHNLWRNRVLFTPRSSYAMDVKKIGTGTAVSFLLIVIDRFSSYMTICRMKDKTTSSVVAALMTNIVWRYGPFSELTIDSERGFQSNAFNEWATDMGIRVVQPLAYSSTGNASGEIGWKHVSTCYKAVEDFPGTQETDNRIAFQWNTQVKAGTEFSPFAIQHGSPATTFAVRLARGMMSDDPAGPPPTPAQAAQLARDMQHATAAVIRVAAARGNRSRLLSAAAANSRSRTAMASLAVGDRAFVYQPASGAIVASRGGGRNRAFVADFAGPATVVAKLSNVGYQLRDEATGTVYWRHRKHLRPIPRAAGDQASGSATPPSDQRGAAGGGGGEK